MTNILIIEKLKAVKQRYEEIGKEITDPGIMSDMKRYVGLNREYSNLSSLVSAFDEYQNVLSNIEDASQMLQSETDEEMRAMANEEIETLNQQVKPLEDKIKLLLSPSDPEDDKNAVLEIRAGTGGDEASIFAGDLYNMYTRYCETKGWKVEVSSSSPGTHGGFKEVVMLVSGNKVYGTLKYESGVHRVQRVPKTETQGRVHTSAATVAVLPEAGEFDVELNVNDIRKDTYCSSGPGGQSVNTTYSAIRLTHIPTGIVVQCQDEKSQLRNYDKALIELRTRIYNLEYQKYLDEISSKRKTMVSSGDRSAKIRTYNYPQSRITDHRIGFTVYNLPAVVNGDIQELIDKLQMVENAERLKEE